MMPTATMADNDNLDRLCFNISGNPSWWVIRLSLVSGLDTAFATVFIFLLPVDSIKLTRFGKRTIDNQSRLATRKILMRRTTRFRELVEAPEILVLPGVHDALSARIAAEAGFSAITCG